MIAGSKRTIMIGWIAAGAMAAAPDLAHAVSVETFVLAIGGQAQVGPHLECTTAGPATPALSFFGNVTPGVPTDGLAFCGVGGDFRTKTLTTPGFLGDALTFSNTFNAGATTTSSDAFALSYVGNALARATSSFTGTVNPLLFRGAASYGLSVDRLTATSPSVLPGTSGQIRLTFAIAGQLSIVGPPPANSLADVETNYSVAGGPNFTLMRVQANNVIDPPFAVTGTGDPLVGFTSGPGVFGGAGEVRSLLVQFVWGQPFDLKYGLLASTIPTEGSTSTVDFTGGMRLSGIELRANGQPVNDFTITSESGTAYGANGVPEPALGATMLGGVASLAGLARRRGRRPGR